jgi:hypothetical protein
VTDSYGGVGVDSDDRNVLHLDWGGGNPQASF